MLAWCSTIVLSTAWPGRSTRQWVSRLIASVVFLTKMTASDERAPAKLATADRAASYARVDTCEAKPAPRCTLEYQGRNSITASATASIAGVLAAMSRFT